MTQIGDTKIIIKADDKPKLLNIKELMRYKELLQIFVYRDLRARYAQSVLGLLWTVMRPLVMLVVVVLVFGRVLRVDPGGVPYSVFALAGIVSWNYFASIVATGNSMVANQNIIKKVYFPRLIIPVSKVLALSFDYFIAVIFLLCLMLWFSIPFKMNMLFLIPLSIWIMLLGGGVSTLLSALTIRFRDLLHIVPVIIRMGFFVSPVAYPATQVVERYPHLMPLYYANPMAGVIDVFRWAAIGTEIPSEYVWVSFAVTVVIIYLGLLIFRNVERKMADIL